jgi:hypothetical protein
VERLLAGPKVCFGPFEDRTLTFVVHDVLSHQTVNDVLSLNNSCLCCEVRGGMPRDPAAYSHPDARL